jgi:NADPH-dependent glutamate synthase beta subunit-like oxidoreductase/2,4-dienoyl-CoA reductase-like NADH-dependent reductase (Old Yellow Enzyme family)
LIINAKVKNRRRKMLSNRNPNAFSFRGIEALKNEIRRLGIDIPVQDDVQNDIMLLMQSLTIEGKTVPNRFCLQPMEGCDGESDGSPGELTYRRYIRFARGGSGMIWVEATAVVSEGRANLRQLWITDKNLPAFKKLADDIRANAVDENGNSIKPFLILQLTHSGRYSKPEGKPKPMIFHHSPVLDPTHNLDAGYPLVTDEYLDELQKKFVAAAVFAYECGYDAIDIKSCHGYLLHEILSAHTRTDSRYGGELKNRIRFLTEVAAKIKKEFPQLIVTSRLNVYDAYPYPYGWGMNKNGSLEPDLSEPMELIRKLEETGITMLNIATGNPYFNPHIERPYDFPSQGIAMPEEHPLTAVAREIKITADIARNFPDMNFIFVGLTWLRELFPNIGIPMLKSRQCDVLGLGRLALANPNYANELFKTGKLAQQRTCITCSSCTQIMRDGGKTGCVIRDAEVYGPIYYNGRLGNEAFVKSLAEKCRSCWGASCMGDCPAGVDVPGFIKAFLGGDTKKAYEIIREKNILAEACAYTCPAEVQCEKNCTSGILDKSTVPVHELQKFIAAEARKKGWSKIAPAAPNGKKVAVIGFGAAGIACTAFLVEKGFRVTVFEASDKVGGTAAAVIPFERLSKNILEDEVKAFGLLETDLFEIRYNTKICKSCTLDNIFAEGFDAVFVGAGMCENAGLPFAKKPEGVYPALDFLNKVKRNEFSASPNDKAAVTGGGNTAMDAAVSLIHAGVRDVYLIYRRSFKELPAWPREVDKALKQGVHFLILNQPMEYVEENGRLTGIKLSHTQLGELDASGRPAPVILPNSEYVFPVTLSIEATGQKISQDIIAGLPGVEFDKGRIKTLKGSYATTRPKVYAGGDIINGGKTVVQAVKEGLDAAKEIAGALK